MTCRLCLRPILIAVSILIIMFGSSSAFHKRLRLEGPSAGSRKPLAFLPLSHPPLIDTRIETNLLVSPSSSTSDFSPDTNAQRKFQTPQHNYQGLKPLHSSISLDNGARKTIRLSRAVENTWSSVSDRFSLLTTRGGTLQQQKQRRRRKVLRELRSTRGATLTRVPNASGFVKTATTITSKKDGFSQTDAAVFVAYFCNIVVLTLSVVAVPAIAVEHNLSPHATAAFCASMASIAPLGGFVGKLVNGFVCQRLGGQRSSCIYMLGLAVLSLGISFSKSLAPVGLFLVGFDFLCSIQWTSTCHVLDQNYRQKPRLKARGLTLLSISSTVGALFAKTFGSGLLQATQWRTVYRCGAMVAILGAAAIYLGGSSPKSLFQNSRSDASALRVSAGGQQEQSALASLKVVLSNPIFLMMGLGHSLGHLARVSDKLLGPFLQEVGGISSSMAVGLTSSVTIGFVLGLFQGSIFTKIESVKGKMNMIRRSYIVAVLSTVGLAACGIKGASQLVGGNANIIMAAITLFSGAIASAVSFQFYQLPNLVSSTLFPESSSVALSLTDAIGFLVTAGVMGINSLVLGAFGWSASWAFMAVVFSFGGTSMVRAMRPVLIEAAKNQRSQRGR